MPAAARLFSHPLCRPFCRLLPWPLALLSLTFEAGAARGDTVSATVTVTARPDLAEPAELAPAASATRLLLGTAREEGARQLDDLLAEVPGMQVQVSDGGFTSAVNLRGFTVNRFYFNGLPDVGRMFVRDLATVQSLQVLRGPAAVLAGINSPGGTLWFEGLRPAWAARQHFEAGLGSADAQRLVLDSTGPLNPALAYRVVAQWGQSRSNPGDLHLQRDTLMAALTWRYAPGAELTAEAERQINRQPFLFGTVWVDGGVRFNQLYASPHQQSLRAMNRQALRWQLTSPVDTADATDRATGWRLNADFSRAGMLRDETLIGFWTVVSPTRLSGYATRYHDDALQHDARLAGQWRGRLAGLQHTLDAGATGSRQQFVFEGAQNIGGFGLSLAAPDFDAVDLSRLPMSMRYRSERADERGLFLQDRLRLASGWTLALGARRLRYLVAADRSRAGLKDAAQVQGTVWQAGLVGDVAAALVPYASYAQGLEPNRGNARDGSFLAPQRSAQWELGLRGQAATGAGSQRWQAVAYRIDLDNLPMTDPLDRTALVTSGARRVQGWEASWQGRQGGWRARAQLNWQHSHNRLRTDPSQGEAFVGVAGRSAAARVDAPLGDGVAAAAGAWLQWQAMGPRFANVENTQSVPGHSLWGAGLYWQLPSRFQAPGLAALRFNATLRNALNRDHVATITALDNVYQGPRRSLWLGLSGSF